jgi:hypothetical protein
MGYLKRPICEIKKFGLLSFYECNHRLSMPAPVTTAYGVILPLKLRLPHVDRDFILSVLNVKVRQVVMLIITGTGGNRC